MQTPQQIRARIGGGILAGGLGRRAGGADKGWLLHQGRPLIEHVVAALRPQVADLQISANRNLARYAALGVPVLRDATPAGQGPLAGMLRLLETATRDWLLCVPCDVHDLPSDLGLRLWRRAQAEAADIAVLADDTGWHPTFCLIRTALAADARRAFAAGERAPRRWFTEHRVAVLTGTAPANHNTLRGIDPLESVA